MKAGTKDSSFHADTLAIHAGQRPDPTTGAIMTPVYQTSTYVQDGPGEHKGYEYARTHNPTREALEKNIAALEGAKYGVAFASGCAAMANVMHCFEAGDHFVVSDDVYGGTYRIFTKNFAKLGLNFTFVDTTKLDAVERAMTPKTKLVWLETPTNPMLKIADIRRISEMARKKGALSLVDNTFMSPYLQRPLDLGADITLHSTTKYLGGHSDVVGGFVGTSDEAFFQKIKFNQNSIGAVPGPWDCFLTMRGTKTLAVRMQRHSENAQTIAEWLTKHPQIEKITYPGLPTHPQFDLAKSQMKGSGGMLTFVVKGGLPKASSFLKRLEIFACAESLGGVESLIEHPAIMTHAGIPADMRKQLGIDDGFIRVSVGIEYVEDLKKDLDQALKA